MALVASILFFILPLAAQGVMIWLFSGSSLGYAMKYGVPQKNVSVQPKPHDRERGKAPIGNNYCHFDAVVETIEDPSGKQVFVSWKKAEE